MVQSEGITPRDRIPVLAANRLGVRAAAVVRWDENRLEEDGWRIISSWGDAPFLSLLESFPRQPLFGAVVLKTSPQFLAALPILGEQGHFLGLLLLWDPQPKAYTVADLDPLSELAMRAAGELEAPIERFRSQVREVHRLSTTEYETIEEMLADHLKTGRHLFGLECGVVTRIRGRYAHMQAVDSSVDIIRPALTLELEDCYCAVPAKDRHTLACADAGKDERLNQRSMYQTLRIRSYLGAPIFVQSEVYGILSFASLEPRLTEFPPQEVELIELMAKSIGRSLLEYETAKDEKRAELLESDRNQAMEMVLTGAPLEEILAQLVHLVERQCPTLTGSVLLASEDRFYCAAAPSLPETYRRRLRGLPMSGAEGCVLSAAMATGPVVFESGAPRCLEEPGGAHVHEYCWQAAGAVPIRSGTGKLLGLLCTYYKLAVQPRHVDTDLLVMAARVASIAIEQRLLSEQLAFQALHDALTGLPNRSMLTQYLNATMGEISRNGGLLAGIFVDLDRFKLINDSLGHSAGDSLLREVAQRLSAGLREGELAARLGGDEFVVLLRVNTEGDAVRRSRQLLEAIRIPMLIEGQELMLTASVGISLYPRDASTADELVGHADLAMYHAKHLGKNDVKRFAPELVVAGREQLEIEHSLRVALENGGFQLYFQPQVDLEGTLEALEVLLSWSHPRLGRVPPGEFIPIAEESGLIVPIGAWVLQQACLQNAAWQKAGYAAVRIAVNVSPLQFARPDFVDIVAAALERSGLEAEWLELEMTESLVLREWEQSAVSLARLRELGVSISIDDFGTGYSSLSYLQRLPVDALKIDRSFVKEMESSHATRSLVDTILGLGSAMGLRVVAEGVESEAQLKLLAEMGCTAVQGHLFSEPLPAESVERILAGTGSSSPAPHLSKLGTS